MLYRKMIAEKLNELSREGRIDVYRAARDPNYNQCGNEFFITAGAPANYRSLPCIFEVDATKKGGPFTDPSSGMGYPNYSFLLPGSAWMDGLVDSMRSWILEMRRNSLVELRCASPSQHWLRSP